MDKKLSTLLAAPPNALRGCGPTRGGEKRGTNSNCSFPKPEESDGPISSDFRPHFHQENQLEKTTLPCEEEVLESWEVSKSRPRIPGNCNSTNTEDFVADSCSFQLEGDMAKHAQAKAAHRRSKILSEQLPWHIKKKKKKK